MKKLIITIAALALTALGAFAQDFHWTNGYIDRNGVFHPGHFQTNPNNNPWDNWSTRGNHNPFTGQPGTRIPQGHYDQFGVWHP
jgi:hypothetical protein